MQKVKKIFTKRIAYYLVSQGYSLVGMEKNKKYPWLDVFVFKETESLLGELDLLSEKK